MAEHPDLTLYKLIHRGMRADTARLTAAVANLTEVERATRMPAIVRWYDGFLHEFQGHHWAEDDIFFPALAERVPVFADRLARLDAEHHRLEAALVAVGEAVGQMADPNVSWASVRNDAVDALAVADMELTLHLDHEDVEVLPLFVAHMSVLDYEELGKRALKHANKKDFAFGIPWIMRQATEEEQRKLRRDAPLPMKVLWYATRGTHLRLTKKALGEAVNMPAPAGVA